MNKITARHINSPKCYKVVINTPQDDRNVYYGAAIEVDEIWGS
jgi:hypothetical protein